MAISDELHETSYRLIKSISGQMKQDVHMEYKHRSDGSLHIACIVTETGEPLFDNSKENEIDDAFWTWCACYKDGLGRNIVAPG